MDNVKYVQTQKLYLAGSGIGISDATINLTSMQFPDGTNVAMTDFGSIGFAVLEPGSTREENISFTGITQNADGSATLTGVTRGIEFNAPYAADLSLRNSHAGGTTLVISNSAAFYNQITAKNNDETVEGQWTFTDPNIPEMDAYSAPTSNTQFATKKYVDDTATGTTNVDKLIVEGQAGETVAAGEVVYFDDGANEWKLADASLGGTSENVLLGVSQGAGTNGNPISGGVLLVGVDENQAGLTSGDKIYLSDVAGAVTNSPGTKEVELGFVVTGETTKIYFSPRFDKFLTEDEQDALGGTSGTPSNTNKYVTADDVDDAKTASKIARRDANADVLVATSPTDADAATSKTYVDGLTDALESGKNNKISTSTAQVSVTNTAVETTIFTTTVPANSLSTDNAVEVYIPLSLFKFDTGAASTAYDIKLKYGATTLATISLGDQADSFTANGGHIRAVLYASGATNTQKGTLELNVASASYSYTATGPSALAVGTSAEDSTGALTLAITHQWNTANANNSLIAEGSHSNLLLS